MFMRCPRCQRTFENQLECLSCATRLKHRSATIGGDLMRFAGSDAFRWKPTQSGAVAALPARSLGSMVLAIPFMVALIAAAVTFFACR